MYDIAVIGAGPAGLTAAMYALRAGKKVFIAEHSAFGGQMTFSHKIENYPGFSAVSGNELAGKITEQVIELGGEFQLTSVNGITNGTTHKTLLTDDGNIEAKAVIIASGASHRRLGVEGEEELIGRGISFCAVCDGAFYKGADIAVIGGGSSALQEAELLSETCRKVNIIHRRDYFSGEETLTENLKKRKNVEFIFNSVVTGFEAEKTLSGVKIRNTATGEEKTVPVSGCFVAIGLIPATKFIAGLINTDNFGYIDADESCCTNIDGIFAAGDCRKKSIRQITTACADGTAAALAACKYIDKK